MPKKELVDLDMHWHTETAAAIRASENGNDADAVWLPKSQIEYVKKSNGSVEVTLPFWLARDKGLV